jgi:hypothetical protein
LVESIDRTYLCPKTHPTVRTLILVNLDIDPSWKLLMPLETLDPPQRAIRETPLTTDASIITNPHKNLLSHYPILL